MSAALSFQQALAGTPLRVAAGPRRANGSCRAVASSTRLAPCAMAAAGQAGTDGADAGTPSASTPAPKTKPVSHLHKPSRRRLILGSAATAMMTAVGCPLCDQGKSLANAAEWGYGDLSGPYEWGDVCKTGTKQSPIDLPSGSSPKLVSDNSPGAISFGYGLANASYLNTGHGTMQVSRSSPPLFPPLSAPAQAPPPPSCPLHLAPSPCSW